MSAAAVDVVLSLPPDSHPDVVRGEHIARDAVLLESARAPMRLAYDTIRVMEELARDVVNKEKLANAAQPRFEAVVARYFSTLDSLHKRRDALEKDVASRVVGDGRDPMGAEIRAHLKSRKDGGLTTATAAARKGDRRTVAAVLSAPAYLSGMSDEEHARFAALARELLEPDLVGLARDLGENIERVERGRVAFTERAATLMRAWRAPDDEVINRRLGRKVS